MNSFLRQVRNRLGLSQAKFAERIGVAANTVARWERGELGMRPSTARLIELLAQNPNLAVRPTRKLTSKRRK